jgi:hypothetical protein
MKLKPLKYPMPGKEPPYPEEVKEALSKMPDPPAIVPFYIWPFALAAYFKNRREAKERERREGRGTVASNSESEPGVIVECTNGKTVLRLGDRVLISDRSQLGQIGRIAKLSDNHATIELQSKELVRIEYKDLQLMEPKDGPLGPLGSF